MKEKVVIMNTELESVLKGFVPVMGNTDDLSIVASLGKLKKKLRTVDNEAFRKAEREKGILTSKMREIAQDEKYLIHRIQKRNFDF